MLVKTHILKLFLGNLNSLRVEFKSKKPAIWKNRLSNTCGQTSTSSAWFHYHWTSLDVSEEEHHGDIWSVEDLGTMAEGKSVHGWGGTKSVNWSTHGFGVDFWSERFINERGVGEDTEVGLVTATFFKEELNCELFVDVEED